MTAFEVYEKLKFIIDTVLPDLDPRAREKAMRSLADICEELEREDFGDAPAFKVRPPLPYKDDDDDLPV